MAVQYERVLAALELREPDRVPTMDMMVEYANIYEIIGKRPLPLGFLYSNPYAVKVMDWVYPRINQSYSVDYSMNLFTYDRTAAAVKMGYDSAWVMHVPIYRFFDTKRAYDIYGRAYDVTLDGKGNLGTPMYREGLIGSPDDWKAWDKRDILRMPEKNNRAYRRVQRDFGDRLFIFGSFSGGLFEITWQSMGFQRYSVAVRREKGFVRSMIRFYTDLYCLILEAMADAGIPGVIYPDDLAYRSGPMLNPRTYEELFGDSYRRLTETAHALGMKIAIHSCGNVYRLLEWFCECGFDGVHALEPTAGMELARVKELVGKRICLMGNIDVTHVLVDATREEVFEAVRQAIREAGTGGGYILAPTNSHGGMSVRRLRWMLEAAERYGRYPLEVVAE